MSTTLIVAAFCFTAVLGSAVPAVGQQAPENAGSRPETVPAVGQQAPENAGSRPETVPAVGQQAPENAGSRPETVVFDHEEGGRRAYTLYLKDGEPFAVKIRNTCETEFTYEVLSITEDQPSPTQYRHSVSGVAGQTTDKVIDVVHDDSYGGYFVEIRRPATFVVCRNRQTESEVAVLSPTRLTITTPARRWRTSVSGAYTLTHLPKDDCADGDPCNRVKQGLATFVHTYHDRFPFLAPMFGLGISGEGQAEYFVGGGLRLGNEGTISFGGVAGKRRSGSNTQWSWFAGFSYAFLDTGTDALERPFAGEGSRQDPADTDGGE